eukprot:g10454.t1
MLSIHQSAGRLCDGISRRELLRVGGLSALGLSLPGLLQAGEQPPPGIVPDPTFGRAKSVIYLWLQGGPPQHETFDPKPHAPKEIRGPFKPISTNVAGIQFCELLPRTARIADKLAVVRSLSTGNNIHSASGYHVLTGYKYRGANARAISPVDWPYFGSLVKKLKPSEKLPPLSTVWIPQRMRLNENVMPAGQTAGMLGRQWDPDRFEGDPADPNYEVKGFQQTDVSPIRLNRRQSLLRQVEGRFHEVDRGKAIGVYDKYQAQAFDILTTGKVRNAFDLKRESEKTRDRFGRNTWGQCLLLARRLVEVGVRMVHVNWAREPGDSAVDNPMWDTHALNADRLEDALCPIFDVGFPALIHDLDERGLLDETLVVAIAEFGRTPKINAKAGRDHWGPVFSFAMAGAGIVGGQVHGSSDRIGGHPDRDMVTPGDVTATIFHSLGIYPQGSFHDPERREHRLTEGKPIAQLLGRDVALPELVTPGGNIARVPPFDNSLLLNTGFEADVPLRNVDFGSRPKGWRAAPILPKDSDAFGVALIDGPEFARTGKRHAAIGFGIGSGLSEINVPQKAQAILAQEMRNPRLGRFTLRVNACCAATSKAFYENVFLKNFTCRLVIYRYAELTKDPTKRQDFLSLPFRPAFVPIDGKQPAYKPFVAEKVLDTTKPGQNFPIGKGFGIAVIVEKSSPGTLQLPADGTPHRAFLRIDDVRVDFNSRTINEKVLFLFWFVLCSVAFCGGRASATEKTDGAASRKTPQQTAASLKRVQQSILQQYAGNSRNVPLAEKAKYFEWAIKRYHLAPWGHVHARVVLSDKPNVAPDYYYGDDTVTWHGALLAAMAHKYAVTRDAETLRFIGRLIEGLHFAQVVSGKPGLTARCVLRRDKPLAGAKLRYVAPDGTVYYVRTDPAKGTYNQVIAAYAAVLLHAFRDLPAPTQRLLQQDLQAMVVHLIDNRYKLIDVDGKPTSYGDLRPLFGEHSVPFNAQLAYMMVATATYFPPPDPAAARKIRKAYKYLKTKHHVYYENPLTHLVCPQRVANNPLIKGMNDRNHVVNAAYYGLALELNSARTMKRKPDKELLYELGRTIYWGMEAMQTHRNALCNFMWAGLLADPGVFKVVVPANREYTRKQVAAVTAIGIEQLRRFPIDRFYYPGRKLQTKTPQWVDARKRHDSYLWKSGPYDRWEITGGQSNTHIASIDFLYAYWVMRYYKLDQARR